MKIDENYCGSAAAEFIFTYRHVQNNCNMNKKKRGEKKKKTKFHAL
jgi:hypothetical protein